MASILFDMKHTHDDIVRIVKGETKEKSVYIKPDAYQLICNHILGCRDTLYMNSDNMELSSSELDDIHQFAVNSLKTYIENAFVIINKFKNAQSSKGKSTFYFHFYDGILYTTPIIYLDKIETEYTLHPLINSLYISCIYSINLILVHLFNKLDHRNKVEQYINRLIAEQQSSENPNQYEIQRYEMTLSLLKSQTANFNNNITQRLDELGYYIEQFILMMGSIIDNNSQDDITYLAKVPDNVWGLYQTLNSLPKSELLNGIFERQVLKLYLNTYINRMVRFDALRVILNNRVLLPDLYSKLKYKYSFILDDILEFVNLKADNTNEYTFQFINLLHMLNILVNEHDNRLHNSTNMFLPSLTQLLEYPIEKLKTIIVGMFSFISNNISRIYENDSGLSEIIIKTLNDTIVIILELTKTLIINNTQILESHLVHFIPYVITNIIEQHKNKLDSKILYMISNIINEFSYNKDFINYLALSISNIGKYTDVVNNYEILKSKQKQLSKLSEGTDEFVDTIYGTFIIKCGFLVLSNGTKILCDRYAAETHIRMKGENPMTREPMSVENFKQTQEDERDQIDIKRLEKAAFEKAMLNST